MAERVQVTMRGVAELNKKLELLAKETRFKGGRAALRRAAEVMANQARDNAGAINDPKTAEEIRKNITVRFSPKTFESTGNLKFRVGILGGARAPEGSKQARATERRRQRTGAASLEDMGEIAGKGKGNPGGDTYYWRFVEFGTERAPAKPFMRPVMSQSAQSATDTFVSALDKVIDRAIKKS